MSTKKQRTVKAKDRSGRFSVCCSQEEFDTLVVLASYDDRAGVGAYIRANYIIPLVAAYKRGETVGLESRVKQALEGDE